MINPRPMPCDTGAIRSSRTTQPCAQGAKPWVLAATILGSSLAFIDGSVVNVALPAIESDLAASVAAMQWVVNAYTLFLAALLLLGGAAGDRLGRRRIFLAGLALFTAASVGCGAAPNTAMLVLGRALQGVGGALLIPTSLAILGAAFDDRERGKAIGTWAAFSAVTTAIGPLLGGWLVDNLSWRAIFFINPVLALPTAWITLRHVPESRDPAAGTGLDWPGALLVCGGLGAVVFALIASADLGWRHPAILGPLVLGGLLLLAFVEVERRSRSPLLPLTLFRSRSFSGLNLLTLLLYMALGGALFLLPFDLIEIHGYSATAAGAAFLPFTILVGGLSRWSGGIDARLSLVIGPILAAAGFALLALAGAGGSYWTSFFPPLVVLGLGFAISVAPLTTAVMAAAGAHRTGVASGVNNAVARLASLLAVAVLGAVALGIYNQSLARHIAGLPLSRQAQEAIAGAQGSFAVASSLTGEEREIVQATVDAAFLTGFRVVMLIAAALALAGAACSALLLGPRSSGASPAPATRAPPGASSG